MRAQPNEAEETAGESEVIADFESIQWAPLPNKGHDLGTDLWIDVRDERRFVRGLIVGAQSKSGPSYFKSPEYDGDGKLIGWWYTENDTDHFDDWVLHPFAHLLVLRDRVAKKSYWVHVTADRCQRTGKGCKVLVPVDQVICEAQADALLKVAAQPRLPWLLDRDAFDASAESIAPGARLRYALLAPRLIAPHPNAGQTRVLEPEEAIGILALRNFFQFDQFGEAQPALLDQKNLSASQDWRWRLVHALHQLVTSDDSAALDALLPSIPTPGERAAVRVMRAVTLLEHERFADALALLTEDKDEDLPPVEHAWILIQRARIKAETGRVPEARADATRAVRSLNGSVNDPTASILLASAFKLLFLTWSFGSTDADSVKIGQELLRSVVNASSSAVTHSHGRTLASVQSSAIERLFKAWCGPTRTMKFGYDSESLEMVSIIWLTSVAGDHQAWGNLLGEAARSMLIRTNPGTPVEHIIPALQALRLGGQDDDLELAVKRILRAGPIAALRPLADAAAPDAMTRSTALAFLKLWRTAADVMDPSVASQACRWCVNMLTDSADQDFRERYRPTFALWIFALDAVIALAPVVDAPTQIKIAAHLKQLVKKPFLQERVGEIADQLPPAALLSAGLDSLHAVAMTMTHSASRSLFLSALQKAGSTQSGDELLQEALTGNWPSVALLDVEPLSDEQAKSAEIFVLGKVDEVLARKSGFSSSDPSVLARLAQSAIDRRSNVAWAKLCDVLDAVEVPAVTLRDALSRIALQIERLPPEWKSDLSSRLEKIQSGHVQHEILGPPGIAATHLEIILEPDEKRRQHAINALLSSGNAERRKLATYLIGAGYAEGATGALHFLIADPDLSVRTTAAAAVVRVCTREGVEPWETPLDRIANDQGVGVPVAFLNAATSFGAGITALEPFVGQLVNHVSGAVRTAAREAVVAITI